MTMTVSELIAILQTLPPDALVVREGYNGRFLEFRADDVTALTVQQVVVPNLGFDPDHGAAHYRTAPDGLPAVFVG